MKKAYITINSKQTQKLGVLLALELRGGEVICLTGELGSGKTTFAQGVLQGLGAKKPYTSPTFVVLKEYNLKTKKQNSKPENFYHMDAYRVGAKDILDLGWEEIIANEKNVTVVEWAERIKGVIPRDAVWIKFEHKGEAKRKISLG